MKVVSKSSTHLNVSSKRNQKKKSKKKKTGSKRENEEYVENIQEAKKLKAKFSSKKRSKDDDMAFLKVTTSGSDVPKVRNSQTHNNLLKRAEEAQVNRVFQIEFRPDVLQTLWMCALCHQRSAQDELGDLFGPYYVNIRPEGQWPSFLFKKSLKVLVYIIRYIFSLNN
ncbi:hypothetical protein GCK32_003872 [Trichostrongylus colubriformis]|uniref:Uncharacterized protein n=1 Tax=Trichostrongylus colubriformis TaxID=6319 RepID=A0AAN8FU59_TRICO